MSECSREELLRLLYRCSPRTRRTMLWVLEGDVAEDDVVYVREELSFMEADNTVRNVEIVSSRLCSGRRVLDTRIVARAQCRGVRVCNTEGCMRVSSRCRMTSCQRHTRFLHGKPFCRRCRILSVLTNLIIGRKETEE